MNGKRIGRRTVALRTPPSVLSFANIGGRMEGHGPLAKYFDELCEDSFFGEKTWEKAESAMQERVLRRALEQAGLAPDELDYVLAGDLLNQCIGSSFGLRDFSIPFFGLYGACSTMGESLALAAMLIDGGSAERGSQVAGYLSQQGITYLDYVVCTSADETHMGGLSGPLYTCAVGQVLSPVEDAGSPVFADFRRYTEAQGLSPAVPEAGSVFPLGDAQVTVVETDDAAQTLSLQVDYGDTSLQFTSDLEDAVAAVASEAEGELPLGALVAESDGTQFFLLDPVQTAP